MVLTTNYYITLICAESTEKEKEKKKRFREKNKKAHTECNFMTDVVYPFKKKKKPHYFLVVVAFFFFTAILDALTS